MTRKAALLVSAVIVQLVAVPAASALPSNPWTGRWEYGAGYVQTLSQGGSSISGTAYRACDNNPNGLVVEGNVTSSDGSEAEFTYSGGSTCPGEGGRYKAVMSADGQSVRVNGVTQYGTGFTDTWRYAGGGTEPRSTPGLSGQPGSVRVKSSGEVTVRRGTGPWRPLAEGDALDAGDEIGTGVDSRATLTFPDGSTLQLNQLTQIRVAAVQNAADRRKVEIELRVGEVNASVEPRQTVDTNFEIKTPTATAGVRGTAFTVFYDRGSKVAVVSVSAGVVEVDPAKASLRNVTLTAGKEVEVTPTAVSKVAPLGKAGLVGGINRVRAVAIVARVLARVNGPCRFPSRGISYSAKPSRKAWLVAVKVAGKLKGRATWRVARSKAAPQNALAKRVARGCR